MAKRSVSTYISKELDEFHDEFKKSNKGETAPVNVIVTALVSFAYTILKGNIHEGQLNTGLNDHRRMFRTAVFYMRWKRGEKGYDRTSNQMIIGPDGILP